MIPPESQPKVRWNVQAVFLSETALPVLTWQDCVLEWHSRVLNSEERGSFSNQQALAEPQGISAWRVGVAWRHPASMWATTDKDPSVMPKDAFILSVLMPFLFLLQEDPRGFPECLSSPSQAVAVERMWRECGETFPGIPQLCSCLKHSIWLWGHTFTGTDI